MVTPVKPENETFAFRLKRFLKSRNAKILLLAVIILAVALTGKSLLSRNADVRKGLKLCSQGEYSDAQTCFKNAVAKDNLDPENYYYLGMAYLGTGSTVSAEQQFQLAINVDIDYQNAYRGMGIAYLMDKQYDQAIEWFNKAIDHSGSWISKTDYDILWYRADAETAEADYDAAVYTYGALLELEGDSTVTRFYRGTSYCRLGKKTEAMEDFDAAIGTGKKSYELYWNIYDSMMSAGWEEEALSYLQLTTQDGYVDTSKKTQAQDNEKYKGMIAYLCGDYNQAVSILSASSFSSDEQAQIYLALAYEASGEYEEAKTLYLNQVNAADADESAYNRIARYYIRCGNGAEAAAWLTKGLEKFGSNGTQELSYNLVTAYETDGDYTNALVSLKNYISVYGENDETDHELAYLKARQE